MHLTVRLAREMFRPRTALLAFPHLALARCSPQARVYQELVAEWLGQGAQNEYDEADSENQTAKPNASIS